MASTILCSRPKRMSSSPILQSVLQMSHWMQSTLLRYTAHAIRQRRLQTERACRLSSVLRCMKSIWETGKIAHGQSCPANIPKHMRSGAPVHGSARYLAANRSWVLGIVSCTNCIKSPQSVPTRRLLSFSTRLCNPQHSMPCAAPCSGANHRHRLGR